MIGRVHHLNCGTLRPVGAPPMVCHVLLLETDAGLVLVDTGLGLADIAAPAARLGGGLARVIRPDFVAAETAVAQVEALGFDRSDVTHIVASHLDSDHTGGIDDFPGATVHATAAEVQSARGARGLPAAVRYRPWRRSPEPAVAAYEDFPEDWFGFAAARLTPLGDDALLVPLPGHTPGHAGVAVRVGDGWLLHCGDAFYHRAAVVGGTVPLALRAGQFVSATRRREARDTRDRLAETFGDGAESVRLVCAHDPVMYAEAARGSIGG
ncbi:MBL fold metallo-hydrolase [Tsukamurella ocularis]|uniref:MBL fold metallo-hydrolase n=1 Tax=Tsukamurella ocularis TaxID=1970234 RepID=UPI00216A2607|nr:MBL fold metallo-hydrolase [Tsukamurella ocularis]MCS3779482.1 glyoxylase-like metal-dependent hydrolase (beta-lactamase superfamily II) [Tsukamurella ocularis]MCS3788045.1 glyoxylase-like metal-dependent hydrolase (beta-lactamase superfamily II) [Tsukamurella ocularis]MCS3852361.1 glyoxylase-like metal-dependent hydrolase (beta-lactamase superfamily II) [Tsukamurella ocularis]